MNQESVDVAQVHGIVYSVLDYAFATNIARRRDTDGIACY
jgi:hypothetical protein